MSVAGPECPYCHELAVLCESSAEFYNGNDFGPVWVCRPCDALVGCHRGTTNPLGFPVKKKTRQLRMEAHGVFDPLWQAKVRLNNVSRRSARRDGYGWLARQLGIRYADCHISQMMDADLERVIALCRPYAVRLRGNSATPEPDEVGRGER